MTTPSTPEVKATFGQMVMGCVTIFLVCLGFSQYTGPGSRFSSLPGVGAAAPYEVGVSLLEETPYGCRVSFRFDNLGDKLIGQVQAGLEAHSADGTALGQTYAATANLRANGSAFGGSTMHNVACSEIASFAGSSSLYQSIAHGSPKSIIPMDM